MEKVGDTDQTVPPNAQELDNGQGVEKVNDKALQILRREILRRAAEHGYDRAQHALANMYRYNRRAPTLASS